MLDAQIRLNTETCKRRNTGIITWDKSVAIYDMVSEGMNVAYILVLVEGAGANYLNHAYYLWNMSK